MVTLKSLPQPSPDMRAYKRNMWMGFLKHPRRFVNFVKYRLSDRHSNLSYLPIKLDVENVSRCNFHCTMCQVSDWPNNKRAEDMEFEDFKKLIDKQYGLIEIKIAGYGEPLLGEDKYFDMIAYARSKNIWVRAITNASLLHLKDNYKKLIDSGVNEVQISIDGTTKDVFEKIRRGSKFERVKANCKLINDYCESKGLLKTRMWTVLQRDNIHQVYDFPPLAKELNFKRLSLSLELTDWGKESWKDKIKDITVVQQVDQAMVNQLLALADGLNIEVTFWRAVSKFSYKSSKQVCPWPFERAFVSSDMRIVPCCMIATPEVADFGDANDFDHIWHSDTYKRFRESHLQGRIPEYCKNCYLDR